MKDESSVSLYHLHMCFRSLNAGRTALPTDPRKDRAVQERSSEVIFGAVYSHRASTIPGSLSSYLWDYTGIPFSKVLDTLIQRSFARAREESFKVVDFGGNIFASR